MSVTTDNTNSSVLHGSKEHVQRIREKLETAEGLGPFWKSILHSALNCIDAERKLSDSYGLALMMIREGCADPQKFAGEILGKHDRHSALTSDLSNEAKT
jgi:hypothetical protein